LSTVIISFNIFYMKSE